MAATARQGPSARIPLFIPKSRASNALSSSHRSRLLHAGVIIFRQRQNKRSRCESRMRLPFTRLPTFIFLQDVGKREMKKDLQTVGKKIRNEQDKTKRTQIPTNITHRRKKFHARFFPNPSRRISRKMNMPFPSFPLFLVSPRPCKRSNAKYTGKRKFRARKTRNPTSLLPSIPNLPCGRQYDVKRQRLARKMNLTHHRVRGIFPKHRSFASVFWEAASARYLRIRFSVLFLFLFLFLCTFLFSSFCRSFEG